MNPTLPIEKPTRWINLPTSLIGWASPDIRRLQIADGLGMLGSAVYQVALPSMAMAVSGRSAAVSSVILAGGAARISLMLAGGLLSDRLPRRWILVAANLLRACLFFGMAFQWGSGHLQLEELYFFSLGLGVCEALHTPARGAAIPALVPEQALSRANTILGSQEKLAAVFGPLIAASLLARGGVGLALAANALILLGNACLYHGVGAGKVSISLNERGRTGGSPQEVFSLLRQNPPVLSGFALVFAANAVSVGPLAVGLPALAELRFPGQAEILGLWMAAAGCGSLAGAAGSTLVKWSTLSKNRSALPLALLASLFASLAGLALSHSALVIAGAAALIASSASLANILGLAQVQRHTPQAAMGKMMALLNLR